MHLENEWINIHLAPVDDAEGNRLGCFQSWDVVTAQVRERESSAGVQSMVEQMPTNVIMANTDLEITYVNPTSVK